MHGYAHATPVQDLWDFLGELLSLKLPEMAELISGMVVGSVVAHLSSLTSMKATANHWGIAFPTLETSKIAAFGG